MKAGGNAWECIKHVVLSSTARSLIYGGHFFWSAGLQKFASLLSCPLSLLSKASESCWGWSHGAFRQPTLFFDSCVGCGLGREAVELGIGRLGPLGCFGFYFFDDPWQKPLSLGLSFFLDYIFWVFQKGLLISPTSTYCTGYSVWCLHLSRFVAVISECTFPLPAWDLSGHGCHLLFISLAPSTVLDSRKLSVNVCCVAGKGVPQSRVLWVHIFCLFPLERLQAKTLLGIIYIFTYLAFMWCF